MVRLLVEGSPQWLGLRAYVQDAHRSGKVAMPTAMLLHKNIQRL